MNIQRILRESVVSIVIISIFGVSYAALTSLTASPSETLTAAKWNSLIEHAVPSKAVMAFNDTVCPIGWSPADGTNFNPDLRGQFLRGMNTFDGGITTRADGKEDPDGTRAVGIYQSDELKSHTHTYVKITNGAIDSAGGASTYKRVAYSDGNITGATGGIETRSRNISVLYCIKN